MRVRLLAGLIAIGVLWVPAIGLANDHYSLEKCLERPVDVLQEGLERLRAQVRDYANVKKSANSDIEARYLRGLQEAIDNTRAALSQKGVRTPPVSMPPIPGAPVSRPGPNASSSRPSAVLPIIAVLSTVELTKCYEQGKDAATCAQELAAKTLAAAGTAVAVGTMVTVVSNAGIPYLSAVAAGAAAAGPLLATAAGVGSVIYVTYEIGSRINSAEEKRATAGRVTPEGMKALIDAFYSRLSAVRWPASLAIDAERSALTQLVARARKIQTAFRQANNVTLAASKACSDSGNNPVARAARVEGLLTDMTRLSNSISKEMGDARALADACKGPEDGRSAREAYQRGANALKDLERVGTDARSEMADIVRFFGAVRAGRASKPAAGAQIALLADAANDARRLESRLRDAVSAYERDLDTFLQDSTSVAVAFREITRAFPPDPPAHIATGLKTIDEMLIANAASVLTRDRLAEMGRQAGDDAVRVEGMHRLATEEFNDLTACGGITDELPVPLKTHLEKLTQDLTSTVTRGQQLLAGNKDILDKAEACARRSTTESILPVGQFSEPCGGAIAVNRVEGPPGAPVRVTATIAQPAASQVTRVLVENPGCDSPKCREMQMTAIGQYTLLLALRAPATATAVAGELGRFHLTLSAYDVDRKMCSGRSSELRVTR